MAIRKRGERYLATVFLGYEERDGKTIRKETAKTFTRRTDAARWERETKRALEQGEWREPTRETVGSFLRGWMDGALQLGDRRDRTREGYRRLLTALVIPRLEHVPLQSLTTAAIEAAYVDMKARGRKPRKEGEAPGPLSASTVRRTHAAFHVALAKAVRDRLIHRNPSDGVELPSGERRRRAQAQTRTQVQALMAGTAEDANGPLYALLLLTGLRPSEALALAWERVNLDAGVVRVERTIEPQKATTGRVWKFEEPKTEKSRRAVPLVPEAVAALRTQRDRQEADKLAAGERYRDRGFVFAGPTGEPLREDVTATQFQRALVRLGLPKVRLYDCRHTFATMFLESGGSLKVLSELLGHSSIAITADTYSHVTPQFARQGVDALASYMAVTAPLPEAQP